MQEIKDLEELYPKEEKEISHFSSAQWYREVDMLFSQILMWYRDIHLLKEGVGEQHIFFTDQISILKQQGCLPLPSLDKISQLLEQMRLSIQRNTKLYTCLEFFFLHI